MKHDAWQLELDFGLPQGDAGKTKPALPRFDEPRSDNERLLNWQYEYRASGDEGALASMYALGKRIALRYISAKARGNRHVAGLSADEREEKAHNAITYIIARYMRCADFNITDSFTAYLYLRVQHELFYRRKVDGIVRFVDMDKFIRKLKEID